MSRGSSSDRGPLAASVGPREEEILARQGESPFILPRVGERAIVHYRWHPQFGTEVRIAYREHLRGEDVAVFHMRDGTRTVLPAWMLDAGVCAVMTLGPERAAISSLVELRATLAALGFDRRVSPVGELERSHEGSTATTIATAP